MKSISIFKALDLPSAFGAALLIFALVLAVAPYLPSGDFGPIKIPDFDAKIRKKLMWFGPLALLVSLGLFIPFFPQENAVRLTNPFGAQQILLDGSALLMTADEMSAAAKKPDAILSYPKELLYINKPSEKSGLKFELIKPRAYFDKLSEKVSGGIFDSIAQTALESLFDDPIYSTGEVFRVFKSPPVTLELNSTSRLGPVVSTQQLEGAKKEERELVDRQMKTLIEKLPAERNIKNGEKAEKLKPADEVAEEDIKDPELIEKIKQIKKKLAEEEDIKNKEMAEKRKQAEKKLAAEGNIKTGEKANINFGEMAQMLKQVMGAGMKLQKNVFNELSILIVDRKLFERRRMVAEDGRDIVASPLQFMLSAGGRLPDFDLLSVKEASVSADNRVWGFYGQTQWLDVKLNGVNQKVVHYDFYRIYVMNSSYLYQITLSYIPTPEQPRDTWDELIAMLRSLRISSQ